VCSLELQSCWSFEGGDELPRSEKTFFSEYGPGSNTKLIKIDHYITTAARTGERSRWAFSPAAIARPNWNRLALFASMQIQPTCWNTSKMSAWV